ncbi:MAG: hypothetical protein HBSAPP03_00300 [Phycisphaerae bacterium]|nr:MAG: hypothetical protein HBSAPP03_00300 [Phycisphaerae bacterium]
MRANRVHQWQDGPTRRWSLVGEVRVILAGREFRAAKASAWAERLVDAQGRTVEQVFVHLIEVGDPAAPAGGAGVTAEELPLRAIILPTTPLRVSGDFVIDGPPDARRFRDDADAAAAGEAALWRSLQRAAGEPVDPPPEPLPKFTPRTSGPRTVEPRVKLPPRVSISPRALPDAPQPEPARTPPRVETRDATPPRPAPTQETRTASPPTPVAPSESTPIPTPERTPTPTPPTAEEPVAPPAAQSAPTTPVPESSPPAPTRPAPEPGPPIFGPGGVVTLSPGNITFVSGDDENAIIATGGVILQYVENARDRVLQLSASRAVVFTDPGRLEDMARLDARTVRGVYLEGDVTASDGEFTVRGPQVYYDLRANKAVMLDAVFWTYDQARQLPIYVRATTVRQTSVASFTAEGAKFTNSPFLDPELSIGASTVTVTRRERVVDPPGDLAGQEPRRETYSWVEARHITGRLLDVPVFYWPVYSGNVEERIIKDLRFENRSGSGGAILSTLNLFPLLGLERRTSVSVDLLADYYFQRGPGVGVEASWADGNQRGEVFAYTVPLDGGTDVMKSGARFVRDDEFRGILLGEQRWRLDERWTLLAEVALLSDAAVIDGFFERYGETRREFTNRLAARRTEGATYFAADFSGRFEDFIANEYLLQSQGYSVTRTPELMYVRHADDLLAPAAPGTLTWFSEYRAGRLELNFDEVLAREHGLTSNTLAQQALGLNANQRLGDALRAMGLTEEGVYRLDTRQELAAQFAVGPVTVNPFIVGRLTFHDRDFSAYSGDDHDHVRLWGAAGVRASTTLQRVYENANSSLLDINRLRHVIEPNLTAWVADATVDRDDLPIYDQDVEALLDGGMIRAGVTQYFQTQRGAPGRWHTVNLLTLSTDVMFASDDAGSRGPIGRFFDFRPEYSNPGDYAIADAVMRLTDAASLTGSAVYDLDEGEMAASSVGLLIRQWPTFTAAVDVRYLNPQDSTYLTGSLTHQLTDKYSIATGANFDTDRGEFQTVGILFQRRFASTIFGVGVSTNEITGDTGLSFVIRPYGTRGGLGVSGLGSEWTSRSGY